MMIMDESISLEIARLVVKNLKEKGFENLPENAVVVIESNVAELSEKNLNLKYLINLQRCMKALTLFRIGMRLNRSDLMSAGIKEFSKLCFLNCKILIL